MRILSFLILFLLTASGIFAQSPHGKDFNIDCSNCHSENSWKIIPNKIKFDHGKTGFELNGQHKAIDCKSCHVSLVFSDVKSDCSSCHTDIHRNSVGFDCSRCHNTASWVVTKINEIHRTSRFPLVGAHQDAECIQCHTGYKNLVFNPIGISCFDCHSADFRNTSSPNHTAAGFSPECQECHKVTAPVWDVVKVNHDFFPLTGGHKIDNCFQCHSQGGNFKSLSTDCYSCHRKDFESAVNPNHITAGFSTNCTQCHNINSFTAAAFDHSLTGFPLTGAHSTVQCASCHTNGFTNTSADCYSCHQNDYNNAKDPNHVTGNFSKVCSDCHSTNSWDNAKIDHNQTAFPLTGAHINVDCKSCHKTGYSNSPIQCYACHTSNYTTAVPGHTAAGISTECQSCHNTSVWNPSDFKHVTTGFDLTGQHKTLECSSCHKGTTSGLNPSCISCHQVDYNNAPNHQAQKYPATCEMCHSASAWIPANFNHQTTAFPLTGAHTTVQCSSCHTNGFTNTPTDCYSCHQNDYNNAKDPNHITGNFSKVCSDCHSTNSWDDAKIDHNQTGFPLTGAHITVSCNSCHTNGFTNTPTDCFTCHQSDYNNTKDPNHVTGNFSKVCSDCHTTNSWDNAKVDHDKTAFPLTGAHVTVSCNTCHTNGYSNAPIQCYACHTSNYTTAVPGHTAAGISTECQSCHNTSAWNPSDFKHNITGFDLTGQHKTLGCSSCHNGTTSGLNPNCISCHQTDYNNAPNHQTQKYPTTCEMCHSTSAWTPSSFNHQTTAFPLTGAHTTVQCSSCHTNGFTNTPTDCYSCHQNDYNNTKDPNHVTGNFSKVCSDCHSTSSWDNATVDHNKTAFPLTGAHVNVSCSNCHTNGYSNTPIQCYACHTSSYTTAVPSHTAAGISTECQSCHNTSAWNPSDFKHITTGFDLTGQHKTLDCSACHKGTTSGSIPNCISCHQTDYNNAPNHQTQRYPTTCEMCHSTSAWIPSSFNHQTTAFPLTGAHTTVQCSSCHTNGFTNTPTDCYSCHQNDYNNTTDPNHQQSGFPKECQTCHSTTSWSGATFDHSTTGFQLTGAHTTVQCSSCHTNGYSNTPTDCYSCHKTNYDNTNNPNHTAAGFPTTCAQCHNTTNWNDAVFDHDNQYFPIYSGSHKGRWNTCADCHTNSSNYMIFECINCHEHNKTDTDNHHRGVRNYVYSSDACYSCHPRGRSD